MTLEEQIVLERNLYVGYCQMAALHNEMEEYYKSLAHGIFYHIQELRSTGKLSVFGKVTK